MLKFPYRPRPRRFPKGDGRRPDGHGTGPLGRITKMRKVVTAVVRHERIEMSYPLCDEARGYVERLIQLAIKNGDKDKETMEMADFWLLEKDLVHKLFKVLAPRFEAYSTCFTKMYNLPTIFPGGGKRLAILELKGNPWPLVITKVRETKYALTNMLMDAARYEHYQNNKKYEDQSLTANEQSGETTMFLESNTAQGDDTASQSHVTQSDATTHRSSSTDDTPGHTTVHTASDIVTPDTTELLATENKCEEIEFANKLENLTLSKELNPSGTPV